MKFSATLVIPNLNSGNGFCINFAKVLYVLADFEPQSNENADFSFMAVRGYGYDRITRISGAVDREMVFLF